MPRRTPRTSSQRLLGVASIASSSLLDFLVPAIANETPRVRRRHSSGQHYRSRRAVSPDEPLEAFFFDALSRLGTCERHRAHPQPEFQRRPPTRAVLKPLQRPVYEAGQSIVKPHQHVRGLSTSLCRKGQPDPGGSTEASTETWTPEDASRGLFDSKAKMMESHSHLPKDFFDDVFEMQLKMRNWVTDPLTGADCTKTAREDTKSHRTGPSEPDASQTSADLATQIKLLKSVRELEEKLARAKQNLDASLRKTQSGRISSEEHTINNKKRSMVLTKDDYMGLVDLYYYSHRDRFHPKGRDYSPSPLFLEDYSFKLSESVEMPHSVRDDDLEDGMDESPLKEIEKTLLNNQMREISAMQKFVDLLLDDTSSNRSLYRAYRMFPHPGVAYLPKGVIRLFLQRMSTPWVKSERAMLRYLSLIDDMQAAKIPITQAEWSSAIYLAGRSLSKVTSAEVSTAIKMWRKMEHEAGVNATHVTFNILFDIAVRAGKYTLAENIMKEMYARDLRLNRLGRVSLIYYHGIRGDGDAVRQTYRDFVQAGEIVDTLVLNCVIASLLNAQEPSAAEQLYERMKDLQKRLKNGQRADGSDTFFLRYPESGSTVIDREAGSNALGRILLNSARLKDILPDHHADLQHIMPLRPDHVTFRALIAYHANVTGDLDRITVLLKEMTEDFGLSMRNMLYQLIFKGFALHGRMNDADERWTSKRLDLVWDSCRRAILDTKTAKRAARLRSEEEVEPLPKVTELDDARKAAKHANEVAKVAGQPRLDPWNDFVLDVAAFPHQRRKPIERIHAQLFDDEPAATKGFLDPFFPKRPSMPPSTQETVYALGNETLDHEEGEYVLPSPSRTAVADSAEPSGGYALFPNSQNLDPGDPRHTSSAQSRPPKDFDDSSQGVSEPSRRDSDESSEGGGDAEEDQPNSMDEVVGSRAMFCWLLRGYARCTGSRAKVEEIYGSIRKLWRPATNEERESTLRVLRRCLRDCDRYGGYML